MVKLGYRITGDHCVSVFMRGALMASRNTQYLNLTLYHNIVIVGHERWSYVYVLYLCVQCAVVGPRLAFICCEAIPV